MIHANYIDIYIYISLGSLALIRSASAHLKRVVFDISQHNKTRQYIGHIVLAEHENGTIWHCK